MKDFAPITLCPELNKLAENFPVDLFVVGGKVRNFLMKINNDDVDLCSSLSLLELQDVVEKLGYELKFKNEELQTAKIVIDNKLYDYARFREESYRPGGNRIPEKIKFVKTPQEDYKRRDFSINALYFNIKTGEYLDYCNGLGDLKKRKIRAVRDPSLVLQDDGLRILRMVRIASELDFKIERETFNAAERNVPNLLKVSGIKLASEIRRICDSSLFGIGKKSAYMHGIRLLNKLKAWKYFGLNFYKLKPKMVKRADKRHFGILIDIIDCENPASVSYFLGKLLEKFETGKKNKEEIINIISGYYDALNRLANKLYFAKYFDNFPEIYKLLNVKSKLIAQKYNFFYKYIINHKLVVRVSDLRISTRDLKKNFPSLPEKSYKTILNMVLSDIFEGRYSNDTETIIKEIDKKLKIF